MWLIPVVLAVALILGGLFYWTRQRLVPTDAPIRHGGLERFEHAEHQRHVRRLSALTEAVAYGGSALILAGGGVAVGERWHEITSWGHVDVFAGAAVFFLAIGVVVLRVTEPSIQRLVGVVWFMSAASFGATAGIAAYEVYGASGAVTTLTAGSAVSLHSAALWLIRRREPQMVALFAGLIITVCGTIVTVAGDAAPALTFALGLWVLGLAWATLGWVYPEPLWTSLPMGAALALLAPSFAVWDHGWVYVIGIVTAAAAMAASVPLRNILMLSLGTIALFGYVTSAIVRYFHESLGLPSTLTITGVVLLILAAATARLRRATRPPEWEHHEHVEPEQPRHRPHQDLPKAS